MLRVGDFALSHFFLRETHSQFQLRSKEKKFKTDRFIQLKGAMQCTKVSSKGKRIVKKSCTESLAYKCWNVNDSLSLILLD